MNIFTMLILYPVVEAEVMLKGSNVDQPFFQIHIYYLLEFATNTLVIIFIGAMFDRLIM